jgi:hypothetical protein
MGIFSGHIAGRHFRDWYGSTLVCFDGSCVLQRPLVLYVDFCMLSGRHYVTAAVLDTCLWLLNKQRG